MGKAHAKSPTYAISFCLFSISGCVHPLWFFLLSSTLFPALYCCCRMHSTARQGTLIFWTHSHTCFVAVFFRYLLQFCTLRNCVRITKLECFFGCPQNLRAAATCELQPTAARKCNMQQPSSDQRATSNEQRTTECNGTTDANDWLKETERAVRRQGEEFVWLPVGHSVARLLGCSVVRCCCCFLFAAAAAAITTNGIASSSTCCLLLGLASNVDGSFEKISGARRLIEKFYPW